MLAVAVGVGTLVVVVAVGCGALAVEVAVALGAFVVVVGVFVALALVGAEPDCLGVGEADATVPVPAGSGVFDDADVGMMTAPLGVVVLTAIALPGLTVLLG